MGCMFLSHNQHRVLLLCVFFFLLFLYFFHHIIFVFIAQLFANWVSNCIQHVNMDMRMSIERLWYVIFDYSDVCLKVHTAHSHHHHSSRCRIIIFCTYKNKNYILFLVFLFASTILLGVRLKLRIDVITGIRIYLCIYMRQNEVKLEKKMSFSGSKLACTSYDVFHFFFSF